MEISQELINYCSKASFNIQKSKKLDMSHLMLIYFVYIIFFDNVLVNFILLSYPLDILKEVFLHPHTRLFIYPALMGIFFGWMYNRIPTMERTVLETIDIIKIPDYVLEAALEHKYISKKQMEAIKKEQK